MKKGQNELFSKFRRIHERLLIAFRKYGIIIWIPVMLLSLSFVLHDRIGLLWEHRLLPTEQIQKGISYPGAHEYSIPLGTTWMSQDKRGTSAPTQVLEDGVPLAFSDSPHADIADKGAGRYSLWGGYLKFSTSDNSDPRTNGRKYELYWPVPVTVNAVFVSIIYILAILITALIGWSYLNWLYKKIISGKSVLLHLLIIILTSGFLTMSL